MHCTTGIHLELSFPMSQSITNSYQLSSQLTHSTPCSLRIVLGLGQSNAIITCTSDGVYSQWDVPSQTCKLLFHGTPTHGSKGLVLSATLAHAQTGTFILSGGTDNCIHVLPLLDHDEKTEETVLRAHKGPVCSLSFSKISGDILSGSYDGTAILWRNNQPLLHLQGHTHGVQVLVLDRPAEGETLYVTGCGTQSEGIIRLWKGTTLLKQFKAHDHVVRRLVEHPLGFVSCGNDGFVKLWDLNGNLQWSVLAHPSSGELDSFVYSLSVLEGGNVTSVGEDGTCKVLCGSAGSILQSLAHPVPVRDVGTLCYQGDGGEDILCVGGDGVCRVWTRHPSRVASQEVLQAYQEYLDLAKMATSGSSSGSDRGQGIDASLIHPSSRLSAPGTRDGQNIVIRTGEEDSDQLLVYSWKAASEEWELVGTASAGGGPDEKVTVSIDVGNNNIQTLTFSRGDDLQQVAQQFCAEHSLPVYHIPDIISHLQQALGANQQQQIQQQTPVETEPEAVEPKYLPCWNVSAYHINSKVNWKGIELALRPEWVQKLAPLMQILRQLTKQEISSSLSAEMVLRLCELLESSLESPSTHSLALLDLLRLVPLVPEKGPLLFQDKRVQDSVLYAAQHSSSKTRLLLCTLMYNLVAKSPMPIQSVSWVEKMLCALQGDSSSAPWANLLFNLVCMYGKGRVGVEQLGGVDTRVCEGLIGYLKGCIGDPQSKNKPMFLALSALGTLAQMYPQTLTEDQRREVQEIIYSERFKAVPTLSTLSFQVSGHFLTKYTFP